MAARAAASGRVAGSGRARPTLSSAIPFPFRARIDRVRPRPARPRRTRGGCGDRVPRGPPAAATEPYSDGRDGGPGGALNRGW
nr:hypothetical protein GCM10010200_088180 [Actinomadura rugatobispora]